jgi:signal transduction histidine kinase
MKFKTRLRIIFIIILLLPLLLTFVAFISITISLLSLQQGQDDVTLSVFLELFKRTEHLIATPLIIDMTIALIFILIFTGLLLTRWFQRSVFDPISDLNTAMGRIRDGNFDYTLSTDMGGEIGDLYRKYEDMRLRLKESAEDNQSRDMAGRELVSNISHDLKTPITAIIGYVEGILDGVADTSEKMDKYIRTIYVKAGDMNQLIDELTIYSGVDNNRIPYNFHRLNVSDYFRDCVEEVGVDLEEKKIRLEYTNLIPVDTYIIADPEQLKRVMNNIIDNSVKYMDKEQGRISITLANEEDSIRVDIADNGRGIASKDLLKIFDRFYRSDSSRNSATGGSGIGLSIVKKIIEAHGGYIWASSTEGEGTCISFVIRKYLEIVS